MIATNIPYLYLRNTTYYYRNQSTWKSLKTKCKTEAFKLMCMHMSFSSSKLASDSSAAVASLPVQDESVTNVAVATRKLVTAYLQENGSRWAQRELSRVEGCLKFLPKELPDKEEAISIKHSILEVKTPNTFNRYVKYFTAFYKWAMSNHHQIRSNPFDGLKVVVKKKPQSQQRNAYTKEQLQALMALANKQGNNSCKYWLILIARYTGARMNEICQLKPEDITDNSIYIRGEVLKSSNAKRTIPLHKELIRLGIHTWVSSCKEDRLFHEWAVVKGSHSHGASRWFSRNNPFDKSKPNYVDFHSIRHTVATELKNAGIQLQYTAQILGHSTGSISYDRYGKAVDVKALVDALSVIGKFEM